MHVLARYRSNHHFLMTASAVCFALAVANGVQAADGAPRPVTKNNVTVRVTLPDGNRTTVGGTIALEVVVQPAAGWHVYANPPGVDLFRPTTVALDSKAKATLEKLVYPKGKSMPVNDGSNQIAKIYDSATKVTARLKVAASASPGKLTVPLIVRYQPCNETSCLAPTTVNVPLELTVSGR